MQAMKPCSCTQILLPEDILLSITVIAEMILEMGKTVGRENKTVLFSISCWMS